MIQWLVVPGLHVLDIHRIVVVALRRLPVPGKPERPLEPLVVAKLARVSTKLCIKRYWWWWRWGSWGRLLISTALSSLAVSTLKLLIILGDLS
jgi:hypothetical protein